MAGDIDDTDMDTYAILGMDRPPTGMFYRLFEMADVATRLSAFEDSLYEWIKRFSLPIAPPEYSERTEAIPPIPAGQACRKQTFSLQQGEEISRLL